jgi:hypothetical protein
MKKVNKETDEIFDLDYLKEFDEHVLGVKGIREKFILATGEVEKGIEEVISIVLFGRNHDRMDLFKDTIISREFFTIENKFDILREIIEKGGIEFENKSERDGFLNQISEVIKIKKLFVKGEIIFSETSMRIYFGEKKTKIGRIIDEDFFEEINNLISYSVNLLRELGEFIGDSSPEEILEEEDEEVGELEDDGLDDAEDIVVELEDIVEEDEEDEDDLAEEDTFKVGEKDVWEAETGMTEDNDKEYKLDEMPDLDSSLDEDD